MSFKTYRPNSTQDVFDLAIAIYGDSRGVADILRLNPSIDLETESYFGEDIVYDDSIVYEREIFVIDTPEPARPGFLSRQFQSIYDLAIQIYGDLQNLDKIISQVESLDDPDPGTLFSTEKTDNILANNLFSKKIVATSELITAEGTGIGFMGIEYTFIVG